MNIELKKVILDNVRLFDHKEFEMDGNTSFEQRNETGKTTLADAISFVLTGKLDSGSSDISSLKPIHDTKLPVTIELLYLMDEKKISLKKVFEENWVKTRGTTNVRMDGHNTTHYINDEMLSKGNYEIQLFNYLGIERIKDFKLVRENDLINIMLNPKYFSETMSWQQRYEIVKYLTGEITPSDVFDLAPETNDLFDDLIEFSIPNLKKRYSSDVKDKKDNVDTFEIQIKGFKIEETISESEYLNAKDQKSKNNQKIIDLRTEKAGLKNPTLEKLIDEKLKIQGLLNDSKQADNAELIKKNEKVIAKIDGYKEEINSKNIAFNDYTNELSNISRDIEDLKRDRRNIESINIRKNGERSNKIDKITEISNEVFEPKESIFCDNCGHDLSATANASALDAFNINKATRIKNLQNECKDLYEDVNDINAKKMEKIDNDIETKNQSYQDKLFEQKQIQAEITKIRGYITTEEGNKIYSYKSEQTKDLENSLEKIKTDILEEQNKPIAGVDYDTKISNLHSENDDLEDIISKYNANQELKRKKGKLEIELETAKEKLAESEKRDDLLKLYLETYLKILTKRLDICFPDIVFKLVEDNIKEGSWNQVCYVMVDSENGLVPYETANTANKIKTGIKIIKSLANAFKWNVLPMVIDNCEAIDETNRKDEKYWDTDQQIISLVAK